MPRPYCSKYSKPVTSETSVPAPHTVSNRALRALRSRDSRAAIAPNKIAGTEGDKRVDGEIAYRVRQRGECRPHKQTRPSESNARHLADGNGLFRLPIEGEHCPECDELTRASPHRGCRSSLRVGCRRVVGVANCPAVRGTITSAAARQMSDAQSRLERRRRSSGKSLDSLSIVFRDEGFLFLPLASLETQRHREQREVYLTQRRKVAKRETER